MVKFSENISLSLTKTNIDLNTEYFNIKDFDLYIKYEDVEKTKEVQKSDRYKNYIYFNSNVVTKNITNFYDIDGDFLYSINKSFDFKILIKDDDSYGVVNNDELV